MTNIAKILINRKMLVSTWTSTTEISVKSTTTATNAKNQEKYKQKNITNKNKEGIISYDKNNDKEIKTITKR